MTRIYSRLPLLAAIALTATIAVAAGAAEVGKAAPAFSLSDVNGNKVSLADFAGKTVVLEWFNPECPFVRYAHTKGPLVDQGNRLSSDKVVWLAINSSAPGKQGNGADLNKRLAGEYGIKYAVLLDESGDVGRAYGARTTPHMFVVNGEGVLAYAGAIDNAPLGDVEGEAPANYIDSTLASLSAGKPVNPAETRSYGCSVKYAK